MLIFDSHCHLEMESYDADRPAVVERARLQGLSHMLSVATEVKHFKKLAKIMDDYPDVYGALGIHPHNSKDYSPDVEKAVDKYLAHKKIVAYGEIGLDFFKNYSPRDVQVSAFIAQIAAAKKHQLPIIVHSRNAREETLRILNETGAAENGGVIHCFSYDHATAEALLDMGFHLSVPGTITYGSAGQLVDVVKYCPLQRLLAETDAPFLTPDPKRGKRNEPAFVKFVFEKIASIKGKTVGDIAPVLHDNFLRLFLKEG